MKLSESTRTRIIALAESRRYTQTRIAAIVGCSRWGVQNTIARWRAHRQVQDLRRTGRPRCTTEMQDAAVVRSAKRNIWRDRKGTIHALHLECSRTTIRRHEREAGIWRCVARRKWIMKHRHATQRLAWAQIMAQTIATEWGKFIFSDEKTFFLQGPGHVWVSRPHGAANQERYIVTAEKHAVKVQVWGCITSQGPGRLALFDWNLDAALLTQIYRDFLLPSLATWFPNRTEYYFVQDRDPKHTAKLAQDWLRRHQIIVMMLPAKSPDLNPIENVWSLLRSRVTARRPTTKAQLEAAIITEWQSLTREDCASLVNSMPDRLEAVIEASGWHTRY
jgi:hypothetical protein